jgi:uncharacterized membrane protein
MAMDNRATVNGGAGSPWKLTTRRVVLGAIFGAMTLAVGGVGLGFIPLPNLSGAGTIMHIPTILGAIVGGPLVGMFCGAIFGVMAMLAFPLFGPFVHIPSRLLIGLVAWLVFVALRKTRLPVAVSAAVAAVAGSLTNTIVTVGVATALGLFPVAAVPTVIPQAFTELLVAAVLTPVVVVAVEAVLHARRG